MALFLYQTLYLFGTVLIVPMLLLKGRLREIRERLTISRPILERPGIWIHAASVGELRSVEALFPQLRECFPGHNLILSTFSRTANAMAAENRFLDRVVYAPVDLVPLVKRFVRGAAIEFVIVAETEIWPAMLSVLHADNIPVSVVNARISDRTYPRYFSLKRLMVPLIRRLSLVCCQTSVDADRWMSLGAPVDRVFVAGNTKFDRLVDVPDSAAVVKGRLDYGLPSSLPIMVAGSTRPGEEDILLATVRYVVECLNGTVVIVPRHVERAQEVQNLYQKTGLSVGRFRHRDGMRQGQVLIVDSMGLLESLYRIADLAFVGGTLKPYGGHNLLEPLASGCPVLYGPYVENQREMARMIAAADCGCCVRDGEELKSKVVEMLGDPEALREKGMRGARTLLMNSGATEKTVELLKEMGRYANPD